MRIKIGIAGLGAVAQSVYLPLIMRRWDLFELVAVADLSPSRSVAIGDQFGLVPGHCYASLNEMLDGEMLDGILLLTSGSHGAPALECMRREVAVFCEKPLALSISELEALSNIEQKLKRPLLLLAYMKEYDPAVLRLKQRLPDLSAVRYVNVEVLHPSGPSQLAYANVRTSSDDIDAAIRRLKDTDDELMAIALGEDVGQDFRNLYSNVLLGSLIHDISLVRSLFGPSMDVDDVRVWARGKGHPGSVEVSGTLHEQARIQLHWHYLEDYPRYRETVTIHHTGGTLGLEFTVPYLLNAPTELTIVSSEGIGTSNEVIRDVTEAFEQELAAFHAMVVDSIPPPTGIAAGRDDIITAQRIAKVMAQKLGITLTGEAAQ